MLHNGVHSKGREDMVIRVRDFIISHAALRGHDVIVDDTNYNPIHENIIRGLSERLEADFEVLEIGNDTEEWVQECIKRDLKRPNSVGEKVIRGMYNQYIKKQVPQVQLQHTEGLPSAIICDLDGTLCLFGDKNPYDRDFENDELNPVVDSILKSFVHENVIFVSGRSDKHRAVTQSWLERHKFGGLPLFMRKDGDVRKDVIIKQEIFDAEIRGKYNVKFVLDDREVVVNYWRSLGLTCLQVASGKF